MSRAIQGVVLLVAASVASAQPAPAQPTEAARLFDAGRALAKAGNFVEACEKFRGSYELDRGVGTEINLADCQERLGHFAEAWRLFDDVAVQSATNPTREKFARARADGLGSRLAIVVVKLPDPNGAIVTIGGQAVPAAAEIRQRVDPGRIEVVVIASGKPTYAKSQAANAGTTVTFDVASVAMPSVETTHVVATVEADHRGRTTAAIVIAGSGVLALGATAALAWHAKSTWDEAHDCDAQNRCGSAGLALNHDARMYGDIATVTFFAGIAAVAAGAALYFTTPTSGERAVSITPALGPKLAGIAVGGTF
jgi:hypothetical protein